MVILSFLATQLALLMQVLQPEFLDYQNLDHSHSFFHFATVSKYSFRLCATNHQAFPHLL